MHSRFWTFCAAGNVLLFLCSTTILYFNDKLSSTTNMSLTHRTVTNWAAGTRIWDQYFTDMKTLPTDYDSFLKPGLDAIGCKGIKDAPGCQCMITAFGKGKTQCPAAALAHLKYCFLLIRPVVEIDELNRSLNPFALLDTVNLWGMMGSVLIWMRMYTKDDESMPYSMQTVLGVFAAFIHCSVMEPAITSFVTYTVLVLSMSFISYLQRLDDDWWVSAYHIQYMFTVPNLVLMQNVFSQKRELSFLVFCFLASATFGLVTFAKTLLEQIKQASLDLKCIHNVGRLILFAIFLFLTTSSFVATGLYYYESVITVTTFTGFHLILGLFGTSNIKRTYLMELFFRVVITFHMLIELGIVNALM
jgi:hypothetical protein